MQHVIDKYLDEVGIEMGRFLRGFEDPNVHLGSSSRFAVQFRRVMSYPAIRVDTGVRRISYAEAARFYRLRYESAGEEGFTPISTMIRGLCEAPSLSPEVRRELSLENLREDLSELLRVPVLKFYLQLSDRELFFKQVEQLATDRKFHVAGSGTDSGETVERISPLPMAAGVVGTFSYDLLSLVVAMNTVETYQEESEITLSS